MSYSMKADFINPFLISTISVLQETVALTDVIPGRPELKTSTAAAGFLSGIVDMSGRPAQGSYAITFTSAVVRETCARLFTDEIRAGEDIKTLASDMIGECANMICGRAKDLLSRNGYDFSLSPPRILLGEKHTVQHALKRPVIQVPFSTCWDSVFVEISFCEANSATMIPTDLQSPSLCSAVA